MKNVKKLLISVFALSALMLGACSGSQQTSSSTPASSSSTQPTTTSTEPTPSSSDAEESSPEEESSSVEESTSHTVTMNEAPTAGRVVVVHAWYLSGGVADCAAEVSGLNVTFDFGEDDYDGYLIAELKEGKVFSDFSFIDEDDPTKLDHDWSVVARQSENITSMSATAASWTTKLVEVSFDTSFTTQFGAERVTYLNSWRLESTEGAGDGASKLDKVVDGKALLLSDADAFELVVLKAGETELILGEEGNWDEVVDAESVQSTTVPNASLKAYYSANKVVLVNDGGELVTHEHTVTVNEAPAANHKVFAHGWNATANFTAECTVSGTSITFDLGTDDLQGYLLAELKDGATTLVPGQGGNWDEVVLRQTNNVTSMTQTSVTWMTPKPSETSSYIAIAQGGDWNNMKYVTLEPNERDSKADSEVYALNVALSAGDLIYIRSYFSATSNGWLHYDQIKADSPVKTSAFEKNTDNDGNIKVKLAGNYDFYCTVSEIYVDAASAA